MDDCEHTYTWDFPGSSALTEAQRIELTTSSPFNVRICSTCGHDDWEPKDKRLFALATENYRYSAMYAWRYPSPTAWSGWPWFQELSPVAKEEFKRRLREAPSYEAGCTVIDAVSRGRKS